MDEGWGLGLGNYLKKNGYKNGFDIMTNHLNRVLEITKAEGLYPMIWSDMYFRLSSPSHEYQDESIIIPEEVINNIPKGVQYVYWDYRSKEENIYRALIKQHKRFTDGMIFAGGLWNWSAHFPRYEFSFEIANLSLEVCKEEGIKEVFLTTWGNDGAANDIYTNLLSFQLYAEHCYNDKIDMEKLKRRLKFCTGYNYEDCRLMGKIDAIENVNKKAKRPPNPSWCILWEDVLTGMYDEDINGIKLSEYYLKLKTDFEKIVAQNSYENSIFDMAINLCNVLELKSYIGIKIRKEYLDKNIEELKIISKTTLPELKSRITNIKMLHRKKWLERNKAFGWEVMDIRYGGLESRIDTAIYRLEQFINGEVDIIEELEAERLTLDSTSEGIGISGFVEYAEVVTGGYIGDV